MGETRSQKASEDEKAMLEMEIQANPALDENHAGRGTEGNGNMRLMSECTPVEQGHVFATSTETHDREEMSELSDISTENPAAVGSPTENTIMHGRTEKATKSSSFRKDSRTPFAMGAETGDEVDTQKEEEDNEKIDDFESQVSLNNSTHENKASKNMDTGYLDRFGAFRTINKTIVGLQHSREFMTMTNSEVQSGTDTKTGSGIKPAEPEPDYEEISRQRGKMYEPALNSTSTKLPGTNRVTASLVNPLVDNGAFMEEALVRIVYIMGEQSEHMSLRMSELERAVHVERESLREKFTATDRKLVEVKYG